MVKYKCMAEFKIKTKCSACDGTGVAISDGTPCTICNQTGYTFDSTVMDLEEIDTILEELDWLHKKVKKILNKLEILEE
jgi:RecJ-like exonuclease